MDERKFLDPKLSINDLSSKDFHNLIAGIEEPQEKMSFASLLYARTNEIAQVLKRDFSNLDPGRFAELFGRNCGPVLKELPSDYIVDLLMEREVIQQRDMLRVDLFIYSQYINN